MPPTTKTNSALYRYGAALGAVALVIAARGSLDGLLGDRATLLPFLLAIVVASLYGGIGPSLFATALSTAAALYFYVQPYGSFDLVHATDLDRVAVFVAEAVAISFLGGIAWCRRHALARSNALLQRSEAKYRERDELFRRLADNVRDVFWLGDIEGGRCRIVYVSPAFEATYGRASSTLDAHDWMAMSLAESGERPRLEEALRRQLAGEETEVEFRIRKPTGEARWLYCRATPIRDASGAVTRVAAVTEDTTIRKVAELELREAEAKFRTVTEAMPQIVWIADPEASVTFFNSRFQELTGAPSEEGFGQGWHRFLHPDDLAATQEAWSAAVATGTTYQVEHRIRRKCGSYCWTLSRAVPVREAGGRGSSWFGTSTDIDAVKMGALALAEAKEAAERANAAKSLFLANMSHEIRTPLAAIVGFAELLRNDALEDKLRRTYATTVLRNGRSLARLIDDILDLSKVESDRLEIERLSVSPREALEDVAQAFGGMVRAKGITLVTHVDDDVPETVTTDPARLRQVLLNVVGNAVKFTEAGEVEVRLEASGSPASRLAFTVRDSGIGIAPEQVSRLFQPFSQADAGTTRRFGGTGLGLALARRLALLMGGDVVLKETAPGRGSTFVVTIGTGREASTVPAAPVEASTTAVEALRGMKILVVEDAPDLQDFLRRVLTSNGASVTLVGDGVQALETVASTPYQVVLMDLAMPRLDGYAATAELRRAGYAMPIVALTAHAMRGERERCLAVGFTDYLTKPIAPAELVGRLAAFVAPA